MGFFSKVFRPVKKVFKAVRVFNFLRNINPWVALGIFAVGWLAFRSRKPDAPDFGTSDFDDTEKGILLNKQSNDASIPVIYGERLVGGTRIFVESSGTDNQYLYVALVLAEGEVNSIEQIKVDEKVVTFDGALTHGTTREVASSDSNFYKNSTSHIQIQAFLGQDDQVASSVLTPLSSWGSNHRLRGICYLALRFRWNQDVFSGIPLVQAKVKGKKVVTLASNLSEQTASFSTNPAFCLLDYLRNERYGKGIATANIDLQSFYDASQVCVTQVTPFSGGSDINIFDTNAVIDTSKKVIDNVRELIKGCRGYLPYVQGKYKLIIETTGTASVSLSEDDIVGGYALASPSKNSKYNRVIASFINPDRNYQVDEVQFPPIDDSGLASADQHSTMKTADGGFLLEGRFDFRTITSPYQAEEMAEIILRRSRESIGLNLNVGFKAYELHIGDIVNISIASLGFSSKTFRVLAMTFQEDYTIGLSLVEYQASHYTFASKTQVSSTPSTTLPNPFVVQPPASVSLSDQLIQYNDGTVIVALDITVGVSPDQFIDYYQVEYKLSSDSNFIIYAQGSTLNHRVLNVIDQESYDVRVKAVNNIGSSSSYVSATRTIVGAIDPPSDVSDLSCNITGQDAHLSWTAVSDLDLAFYQIRFSDKTDGTGEWLNSVNLVTKVSRPATSITVPARAGTYLIKAVDKLGNFSSNATAIVSNVTSVDNFNNITTVSEHPTFSGTKTNVSISDDALILNSSELFDSASGLFDANTTRFFDSGVANADFQSTGNYQFSDVDVMLFGTAVNDISKSFDDYWNHEYAYDVREIVNPKSHRLSYESLKQQLDDHYKKVTVQNYLDLTDRSQSIDALINRDISLDWVKAEVVKDSPDKIKSKAKKQEHLNFQLINHLEQPEKNIDLISAYFVPEKKGAKILGDLAQDGVKVRVLTNSFKANDVAVVHAFYGKYRKELLEQGLSLIHI